MNPMTTQEGLELEIQIEELEPKIAPDGGETAYNEPVRAVVYTVPSGPSAGATLTVCPN